MSSVGPDPIGGLVLITPAQRRFVQTLSNMLENDPLPKDSIETLKNIFQNILKQPNELKFRRLKANNPKFHERVGRYKCAVKVLEHAGFVYEDAEFSRKGVLQDEDTWELRAVAEALASPKVPIRPDDVLFYDLKDAYGEFSNYYPAGIKIDNKIWPTTEHYFQAQKFAGTKFEDEIRTKATPDEAKKRGSEKALPLRKDWEQVKEDVMYKACLAKFTQHDKLKQKLLSTGRAFIIEHTEADAYWGDGGNYYAGSGRNRLGAILMKVRDALVAQVQAAQTQAASAQAAQKIEEQHQQHVKQVAPAASSGKAPAPAPAAKAPAPAPAASSGKAPAPAAAVKAPAPAPASSSKAPAPAAKAPAPAASSSKAPAASSSSAKPPVKK